MPPGEIPPRSILRHQERYNYCAKAGDPETRGASHGSNSLTTRIWPANLKALYAEGFSTCWNRPWIPA